MARERDVTRQQGRRRLERAGEDRTSRCQAASAIARISIVEQPRAARQPTLHIICGI